MLRLCLLALSFASAAATNAAGQKFLDENKNKEGVVTLPSGLQYKVLRSGDGDSHPTADSSCECHYEGRTAQEYIKSPKGETFDSSYARGSPTSFAPNQVIKAWTEAMQLMVEGDKWEMFIPSDLGYGDRGSPPKIGGGDALIFTMEIIKINGNKVPASKCDVKTLDKCSEKESDYITKKKALTAEALLAEEKRLEGMKGKKMSPEASSWLSKRLTLIGKMAELKRKDEL
jgi:FKBP-type peptidyl-prolyl cis-trans isomerase FklB